MTVHLSNDDFCAHYDVGRAPEDAARFAAWARRGYIEHQRYVGRYMTSGDFVELFVFLENSRVAKKSFNFGDRLTVRVDYAKGTISTEVRNREEGSCVLDTYPPR